MKVISVRRGIARIVAALVAAVALKGAAMAEYDFEKAWKDVEAAQRKNLPRTVTNKVEEIELEATKAERWPDAARAFLVREDAMKQFTDGESRPDEWLPAFAASVDAKPAPLQAVLQLHLAHTYFENFENSCLRSWGDALEAKLDDAAAKDKMPPWSPEKIDATLESQFAKVFAFEAELKAQKMSDWKALFELGTVPESFCPTLFDFAVRDAVNFYSEKIPDETLEKGLALYDKLLAFHAADANRDACALAELHKAEYVREFRLQAAKKCDADFMAFLDGFLARWDGKTQAAAFAAERKAGMLRDKDELVAARALAAEYAAKWPNTLGGKLCAYVVAEIEQKDLAVEAERTWCAPWPEIKVMLRNLDEVHFRLVPVSFDDLVSDRSMGKSDSSSESRAAIKDKYLTRAPAKEWVEKFPLKGDYSEQSFTCPVPQGLPAGHYVLYAAANEKFGADKQPLYAQYVTVTSLALVDENGHGEFKGAVYRAESGVPVAGATVELWGLKSGRFNSLLETYTTDAEGRFVADVSKGRNGTLYRHVRVIKDGEEVLSLGNESSGYVSDDEMPLEHIDLFTDRSLYRPGQEIKVKGVAYHADPATRDFRTQTNMTVRLTLTDPNDKEVASVKIRPNKWGSFVHTFTAPSGRLTGTYRISAWYLLNNGRRGDGSKAVSVEEYKRPKFTAEFEKASDDAKLGAPVEITGKALTYSGLPVQNAKVAWHVERVTRYAGWWRWLGFDANDDDGDGYVAEGETVTDENGVFKVTFTPEASPTADLAGEPSFDFTVTAEVTDETGEERTAEESFEIGTVAWRANVWAEGDWHEAGRGVEANVTLASLAGTKVPVKGTLKALRLKEPEKVVRKPAGRSRWGNEAKGPWDWKTWEVGEEVLSVEANGEKGEKWTTALPLGVGAYRLVFEAKDPNGKTVKAFANVCVIDPAKVLGMKTPDFFEVEKTTVKVGETLRAYWGTGYATGCCRVKVTSNGKVLVDKIEDATRWLYELPITDAHRGEIRIETTFVRENRIYHGHHTIHVPWDNKYLEITAEHLTSKLNPGKEETWKFKVSGPSEVLAFMYDRSLDAYTWHDVSLGFSRYFTPWTRWLGSPSLHNALENLTLLDGCFPNGRIISILRGHQGIDVLWPSWRVLPTCRAVRRFGAGTFDYARKMRAPSAMASGAGVVEACAADCEEACEDMLCDVVVSEKLMRRVASASVTRSGESSAADVPRKNLKETAFFFPDLETDADGNVSFTFTAPDALTGWKLLMVAHDNELRGGIFRNDEIVTTKPLMCEPNPPRFAREGDDFLFPVKVTNTEDWEVGGDVCLMLGKLDADELDEPEFKNFHLAPHESKTIEFRVSIPDGSPYLRYIAKATAISSPVTSVAVCGTPSGSPVSKTIVPFKKYTDGEEGVLPVLARRILVREAAQLNAHGNETKSFKLDNLLASKGSETIRHQDLTVRAVSRPAWYAVLSLPYLMEFPHECCEQTFSRYYANALGAHIANSDPRIRAMFDEWKAAGAEALKSPLETNPQLKAIALEETPWVREAEHETKARARLGDLFGEDRLKDEQSRCMEKLRLARNADGLWPWFPGGRSSDSISLYILVGFARLNRLAGLGYPDFFASAVAALDEDVSENVKERLRQENLPLHVNGFDIRWMYLHSFRGVAPAKDKTIVPLFVEHIRKEWTDLGLETQALAAIVLKRMGEARLVGEIMASIKERGVLSEELGMYWKRPYFFSSSVFAAPVSTQALIIEAFREATGDEASAEACNVWLLKQKQTQDWTTTAATADAIYALLLGGGADLLAGDKLAEVTLGGVKVPTDNAEKGTGMYSHRYAADEIKPEMGEITFKGAGEKGVSWGGVHWSYFEDVLKVRAHEPKELSVEKKYYKKVKGPEGTRLTAIEGVLEPGDEIVARIEIKSDRSYEFVHLSDGRPACAEPEDVLSSYRWRDGVGYYQSTKDTATHYYIDRLNKGVFVLETSYRVQQKGVFTGGIATIQCMYAPEFTAHSSAETVRVNAK